MPLRHEPFVVEGGCNCKAIRYRVSIPEYEQRPFYPAGGPEATPEVRTPVVCTDHCNDCRSATGSILPCWLLTPIEMVTTSFIDIENVNPAGRLDERTPRTSWRPAAEAMHAEEADPATSLAFFASSEGRRRVFCRRCGTMFAYLAYPSLEWLKPEMLDIVLGTIDREYLDTEDLRPNAQLWWECGVSWIQQASRQGLDVPVYLRYDVKKPVIVTDQKAK